MINKGNSSSPGIIVTDLVVNTLHTCIHACSRVHAHRHIPCSNEYSYTASSSLPLHYKHVCMNLITSVTSTSPLVSWIALPLYVHVCMNLITLVTSTSQLVSWIALDSSWTTSFGPCFRSPWTQPPTLSCTASCNR